MPHNIIGPRQKYNDPYRNVASIMINLMLQGRQPIIFQPRGEQKPLLLVRPGLRSTASSTKRFATT